MANQKISELNSLGVGGLDDSDVFVLVDSSATETKHVPWGSLKIPPLIGAKVIRSVNSTGMDLTAVSTLFWDTEKYDTHGFHAAGATNYRLTVPPAFGGMYFDVCFAYDFENTTADKWGQIILRHFNAAGTQLQAYQGITESGNTSIRDTILGLGVLCDSGDYFQTEVLIETDTSVDVTTRNEFSILLRGQ